MSKFLQLPIVKSIVEFLQAIKLPGFFGFSVYDLVEMYTIGIVKGALTSRAGSISYSFFMALFPFLLFVLNLIPFVDMIPFIRIDNFDETFLNYLELFLPTETQSFFTQIFDDIKNKPPKKNRPPRQRRSSRKTKSVEVTTGIPLSPGPSPSGASPLPSQSTGRGNTPSLKSSSPDNETPIGPIGFLGRSNSNEGWMHFN